MRSAAQLRDATEDPASIRFLVRLCQFGAAIGLVGIALRRSLDPSFSIAVPVFASLAYLGIAALARRGWTQTAGVLVVLWTTLSALSVGIQNNELEAALSYTALALFIGFTILPTRSAIAAGVGVN